MRSTTPEPRTHETALDAAPAALAPVVLLASACWATAMPVNAHQIARRLAARGRRVLFVESTGLRAPSAASGLDRRRIARRLGDALRGVREVAPRLFVHAPIALPGGGPRAVRTLSLDWLGRSVARACRGLELDAPILWAMLPTHARVARFVPHRRLVYHCVDRYAGNPGTDGAWLDGLEGDLAQRADVVLAASDVLGAHLRRHRLDVRVVPNVADVRLFRTALAPPPPPPWLAGRPRPRIVFVGNLARYRLDLALVERIADAHPDGTVVLVGEQGHGDAGAVDARLARLRARPNVVLPGPQPHETLPALLAACDVAVIPFVVNEHTRACLPIKLWEFVAAGLPVVATDLPNLRPAAAAGAVELAASADAFLARIGEVLVAPWDRDAQSRRADGHGWETRIAEIEAVLGGAA